MKIILYNKSYISKRISNYETQYTLFQYGNQFFSFLGQYQIPESYLSNQSSLMERIIDRNKNIDFISKTSNIKTISSNAEKLWVDGKINTERYNKILIESFLGEVQKSLINRELK